MYMPLLAFNLNKRNDEKQRANNTYQTMPNLPLLN